MRGGMVRCAVVFCLCVLAPGPVARAAHGAAATGEVAYQRARQCYYELLGDTARLQRRDQWEACLRRFWDVTKQFPRSPRTPEARFNTARLYEQLFQVSKNREDLRMAATIYRGVARLHKDHRLADDALYRAGVVYWQGFRDGANAEKMMSRVVRRHRHGDMRTSAQQFLAQRHAQGARFRPADALLPLAPPSPAIRALAADAARQVAAGGAVATRGASAQARPVASPADDAAPRPLRIVLDPGHGGDDPGARGPTGTLEKTVTLAMARKLALVLQKRLGAKVLLTRYSDRTVSLESRNQLANRNHADLFISIHANAATDPAQHGIQTYYLNNASDDAARRLAARENAVAGRPMSDVDHIMSSMLQNAFTEDSRLLADAVHRGLVTTLGTHYAAVNDQQVRSAMFYVLVGAKSPAILVETSYVSNPREEARLRDPKYQNTIVNGIADGIGRFLRARRQDATL